MISWGSAFGGNDSCAAAMTDAAACTGTFVLSSLIIYSTDQKFSVKPGPCTPCSMARCPILLKNEATST